MEIHNLADFGYAELAEAFNQAFADYLLPIHLTPAQLAEKFAAENIRADLSVGVTVNDRLVAFIFTGIDKIEGQAISYNAGTGVIPEFRGKQLTQKMYAYLLPFLAELNISCHRLEVLTENIKALRLYEKIGYRTTRKLSCFKGKINTPQQTPAHRPIKIVLEDETLILPMKSQVPAYQNTFSSISRNADAHETLGVYDGPKLIAYLIFAKDTLRVKQFGVHPDYRRKGIGHQLFHELQQTKPEATLMLINSDSNDSGTAGFLKKIGMEIFIEQYEMVLTN